MTSLGRELVRRGHCVTVVARPDGAAKAVAAGLGFAAIGATEFPQGAIAAQARTLGGMTALKALRYTIDMMRLAAEVTLRDLPTVCREIGIEGLLVDQVNPAAGTVAEIEGLPFVKVANALALNRDPACPPAVLPWRYRPGPLGRLRNAAGNWFLHRVTAPVRDTINAHRVRHGLAPRISEEAPLCLAEIAQQPAFFDFPRARPEPRLHFTGPWHAGGGSEVPFPWDRLDGRPLVYASLGTLQNRLAGMFTTIAEAVASLDVQLVLSLGAADQDVASLSAHCPGDPILVPVAPQMAILDRATLAITHAGLNTTLESLARGVPMVAIPITNDQPGVARRLEWLGLAEVVLPKQLTAARLRQAVERVLGDTGYRTRAGERAAEIARLDGVGRAADIVEEALRTNEPVLSCR
ncbi:MAG: nucleotide disphospho-sugar-binding domain-containing protein [Planctomycetia bacterium]